MQKLTPNKMLTDFLKEVGAEKTETAVIDGKTKTISKAEAVARSLYAMATGEVVDKLDGKGVLRSVHIKPDPRAIRLIREYTEGKPSSDVAKDEKSKKKYGIYGSGVQSRLTEALNKGVEKINKGIEKSNAADSCKTGITNPISRRPTLLDRSKNGNSCS